MRKILVIDVGGSNVKMMISAEEKRRKFPSGPKLGPTEAVEQIVWDVIAGHRPQTLVGRVGKIGAHRVGAERQADLASDASHRLGRIERRAQRPAHRQQGVHLTQPQLLASQQLRPLEGLDGGWRGAKAGGFLSSSPYHALFVRLLAGSSAQIRECP